jgi:N utilization substance protein A
VREVFLDDENKEATVITPDDQLALAIGKEGMNARLAARLTGWKVDITSDTEFAQQEAAAAFGGGGEDGEEGDFSGRCSAILSNGKRCPNASLPGSKYCGVPAHQALADQEPAEAEVETAGLPVATQEEVETVPVARDESEPQRVEDDPHGGIPFEEDRETAAVATVARDTGADATDGDPEEIPVAAPPVEGGVDPEDQRI